MSNSNRSITDLLALEDGCRTCGAARGEWCRIRDGYKGAGEPAQFLHVERTRATYHARWVGYAEGQLDALRRVAHELDQPTADTEEIHRVVQDLLVRADRWAQSAHQRALEDIPEGWHR